MPLEILNGNDVSTLLARAQAMLGEDAVVLSVRRVVDGRRLGFELTVADPVTAERHRRELEEKRRRIATPASTLVNGPAPAFWDIAPKSTALPTPAPRMEVATYGRPQPERPAQPRSLVAVGAERKAVAPQPLKPRFPWPFTASRTGARPRIIALVGPTGAGKTTTLAKLANHSLGFAGQRVGLVCLDTYRVGAVEQSRHYAELSRIPFEVVWDRADVPRVHKRMRDRDVVLVDTPGRGPRAAGDLLDIQQRLVEMLPDEVHLVVPAGIARVAARRMIEAHLPLGVTHLLPTKLDEHPGADGLFELATQYGLPMRWLTDGQEVPSDLQAAPDLSHACAHVLQTASAA